MTIDFKSLVSVSSPVLKTHNEVSHFALGIHQASPKKSLKFFGDSNFFIFCTLFSFI